MPKVTKLSSGELGFESRCAGPTESLRVNFIEAVVEEERLFRNAALQTWKESLRL